MASLKEKFNVHKTNVQARLGEKFGVIADEVERVRGLGLLGTGKYSGSLADSPEVN